MRKSGFTNNSYLEEFIHPFPLADVRCVPPPPAPRAGLREWNGNFSFGTTARFDGGGWRVEYRTSQDFVSHLFSATSVATMPGSKTPMGTYTTGPPSLVNGTGPGTEIWMSAPVRTYRFGSPPR